MSLLVNLAALSLIALVGPVMALAKPPSLVPGHPVLVISSDAEAIVQAAGGRVIGPESAPFAVLAAGGGDLIERLHEAGAWHTTDGRWIAELCGFQK